MFNFLNSAILFAAAAALIPLLIHLFSKRRVKVIEFSSLKHLKEMQKRQVRRIKIRQLLLLLLRILIILAAVLAFARPASKGGFIGSHAGVSAVIMLDVSASMQRQVKDGRLYDLAKKSANDILENFGQSDEVILLPYDRQARFPAGERFFSRETAERLLGETDAGYNEDNLQTAYNKAIALLAGAKNLNKELYIITDRQLKSLPENVDEIGEDVSCYLIELPTEVDGNCAVFDLNLGGQLIEVGSDFLISAQIQNYDTYDKTELLASLFVDGARVMQTEYAIDANGRRKLQFKHRLTKSGFHSGWVELSDDGFPADNKFYFSFKIPDLFNVLIIDGDQSGELIRLALMPSEKLARYWSVKITSPDKTASIKLNDYNVIVVTGVAELGKAETTRLMAYVDHGGGLFWVVDDNVNIEYFNSNLAGPVDLKILKSIPPSFSRAGHYTMERFDYGHPIFTAFEFIDKDSLPTLKFFALPQIEKNSNAKKLALFSNGSPALVEGWHGMGRIIVMTAPIKPKFTDLASHSFFVPFIIRTMEYLANDMSAYQTDYKIGSNISRTIPASESGYTNLKMKTPNGRSFEIAGVEQSGGLLFNCQPIEAPGIYLLKNKRRTVDMFPVNLPNSESDLSTVGTDRLKTALKVEKFKAVSYDRSFAAAISEARFGREMWKIFLWLAALLMLVEILLARESGNKPEKS